MIKFLHSKRTILLSGSIGIVYLWFGGLKFFSGLSPAEQLATDTISELTFGLINHQISLILLAIWETAVGILFLINYRKKWLFSLTLIHMVCTFTPFLFFPGQSITYAPLGLSLIGQYIIKNLVIISALISLYPVDEPQAAL